MILRHGIAAAALVTTSLACAEDFDTGQVWGLVWDNVGCVTTPNGVQGGAWDQKFSALSRELVFEGNGLKVTATFDDGRVLSQFWFRSKEMCEKARLTGTRTELINTAVARNRAPTEPTSSDLKRSWYSHDLNHRQCVVSRSPADRIRDEQGSGRHVETKDLPGGAVEVNSYADDGDNYTAWTYYRSNDACISSLPGSQKIRSDYE